jgi:hypothetical protein
MWAEIDQVKRHERQQASEEVLCIRRDFHIHNEKVHHDCELTHHPKQLLKRCPKEDIQKNAGSKHCFRGIADCSRRCL